MKNDTMQAWQLHRFGLDGLEPGPLPLPVPGPREVLIRVSAASLNFRDKAIIDGVYNPDILKDGPLIPVGDAVGEVVQIGGEVTRAKVGKRVTSHLYSQGWKARPAPTNRSSCSAGRCPAAWPSTWSCTRMAWSRFPRT